ncbi:hypothetical protein [Nocardiopsis dassonvillei]
MKSEDVENPSWKRLWESLPDPVRLALGFLVPRALWEFAKWLWSSWLND